MENKQPSLSDKIEYYDNEGIIYSEDVKEAIKILKDEFKGYFSRELIYFKIDKVMGDKLI